MRRAFAGVVVVGLALAGCEQDETKPNYEYAPDMVSSVPYDSFSPNPNTPDGKTLLVPAKGTVPRGFQPLHLAAGPEEAERAGAQLKNPYPASPEVVARGRTAFQRYCSPCHGSEGLGDGTVTARFPVPPSLVAEHARGLPDGRIFHIITHGQGLMPAHGSQVAPEDRWKVVHYLRTLQDPARTARKDTP
ncbi:cytochrome c [Myxococcus sp. K15C18031901]|uniref:c-type cytochrome n=1 Tax=Myxococcus dinghuensis TaxID=2906761 RepID=UPI0020A7E0BF|nr:c-type cytochrome [Myxococcus dinghuensis]MCP3098931.1 cytochrome c [Myxococcus dinghuensis]